MNALIKVSFGAMLAFRRHGEAEYTTADGTTVVAEPDAPRLDYRSDGAFHGLLLDSSETEEARIVRVPLFREGEGTWSMTCTLAQATPLSKTGMSKTLTGSGRLVFTYRNGIAKCFAGALLYEMPITEASVAARMTLGGRAAVHKLRYTPRALPDALAIAQSHGNFEVVPPEQIQRRSVGGRPRIQENGGLRVPEHYSD